MKKEEALALELTLVGPQKCNIFKYRLMLIFLLVFLFVSLFQCILSLFYLLSKNIGQLINYFSFVTWLATGAAIGGLLIMRVRNPDLHRPVKVLVKIFFPTCHYVLFTWMNPENNEAGEESASL